MKTMKRIFLSLVVVSVSALLLFGCGSTAAETETPTAETPTADLDLSTAKDTFQLELLPQLLNAPDAAIVEMFGESEGTTEDEDGNVIGREYTGVLFGQDIRLLTTYDADTTVQVDITFDSTEASLDQLSEALVREIGLSDDDRNWEMDGAAFSLNDTDGTPTLTVTMAE